MPAVAIEGDQQSWNQRICNGSRRQSALCALRQRTLATWRATMSRIPKANTASHTASSHDRCEVTTAARAEGTGNHDVRDKAAEGKNRLANPS